MRDFATSGLRAILAHNRLHDFDDVWRLGRDWVEPPNTRHGGFGAVARRVLETPDGGTRACFIKIHRNRIRRTALRPWRGTPALVREFDNHRRCAAAGVASPEPVYFANRFARGEHRGILITGETAAHRSLEAVLAGWAQRGRPSARERRS